LFDSAAPESVARQILKGTAGCCPSSGTQKGEEVAYTIDDLKRVASDYEVKFEQAADGDPSFRRRRHMVDTQALLFDIIQKRENLSTAQEEGRLIEVRSMVDDIHELQLQLEDRMKQEAEMGQEVGGAAEANRVSIGGSSSGIFRRFFGFSASEAPESAQGSLSASKKSSPNDPSTRTSNGKRPLEMAESSPAKNLRSTRPPLAKTPHRTSRKRSSSRSHGRSSRKRSSPRFHARSGKAAAKDLLESAHSDKTTKDSAGGSTVETIRLPYVELPEDEIPRPGYVCSRKAYYSTLNNETVIDVGRKLGCSWEDILKIDYNVENVPCLEYAQKKPTAGKFRRGTILRIPGGCFESRLQNLVEPQSSASSCSGGSSVDSEDGDDFDSEDEDEEMHTPPLM